MSENASKQTTEKQSGFSRTLKSLVGRLNVATSPEGCTAVDARKLREYNHGLAEENGELRIALQHAINRPKGVVPDSALKFYTPNA